MTKIDGGDEFAVNRTKYQFSLHISFSGYDTENLIASDIFSSKTILHKQQMSGFYKQEYETLMYT